MDDYLIDRQTLEQFVDELIKKRNLPVSTAEEIASFKEEQIKNLDDRITKELFSQIGSDQVSEFNRLLENSESSPEVFEQFFKTANIDVEKSITNTMQNFALDFLGGKNE